MKGAHLDEGTFTHSLLHEPELIAEQYAIYHGFRRAGKDYDAFVAANPGKMILSRSMEANGRAYAKAVTALPEALKMLKRGQSELSIALVLHDVPVKARFDNIDPDWSPDRGIILDTKTSRDPAGKEFFKHTIKEYKYDLSAALYSAVAEAHYGKPFDFYWLVISKTAPPEARLYKASAQTMTKGRTDVSIALEKYKHCLKTGLWLDEKPERVIVEEIEEI